MKRFLLITFLISVIITSIFAYNNNPPAGYPSMTVQFYQSHKMDRIVTAGENWCVVEYNGELYLVEFQ